jgi:plasmid stabilization system protein ParE
LNVVWQPAARAELNEVRATLRRHSPQSAIRFSNRLRMHLRQIGAFPYSGRIVPELGREPVREVFEQGYRIIYHVGQDRIEIIGVIHGARRLGDR